MQNNHQLQKYKLSEMSMKFLQDAEAQIALEDSLSPHRRTSVHQVMKSLQINSSPSMDRLIYLPNPSPE